MSIENCLLSAIVMYMPFIAAAQSPVKWTCSAKKTGDKTYEIHVVSTIDHPWHIYSQFTPEDGPSLPTKIFFNKNPLVTLSGKVKEIGNLVTKHEEILDVDLKYYNDNVDFVQVVNLKNNVKTDISGTIEFTVCTDERCLMPQTIPFTVTLQ